MAMLDSKRSIEWRNIATGSDTRGSLNRRDGKQTNMSLELGEMNDKGGICLRFGGRTASMIKREKIHLLTAHGK